MIHSKDVEHHKIVKFDRSDSDVADRVYASALDRMWVLESGFVRDRALMVTIVPHENPGFWIKRLSVPAKWLVTLEHLAVVAARKLEAASSAFTND